jgi:hypothetical protein
MKLPCILLASLVAVAMTAARADAAGLDIDKVTGVYKKAFRNGDTSGEKYTSENILEIVKLSPTTAYFRVHLEFFNGHLCEESGVARVKDRALVYHGEVNTEGKQCVLSFQLVKGKMTLGDEGGACRAGTCGARGGYDFVEFDMKRRRSIRYMKRLLNSEEYKAAIEEFKENSRR